MAENVRPGVEIVFADKARTVYPVSLKQLRKLNTVIKDLNIDDEISDETIDKMIEAAAIILAGTVDDDVDLEEIVDIRSFNRLLAAGMGADPNELAKINLAQ